MIKNFTPVLYWAITAFFLLQGTSSFAQPGDVDGISVRLVEFDENTLEVQLQPNATWTQSDGIVNLTFAVRWETSAGGSLGDPDQLGFADFCMLQGVPLQANPGIDDVDNAGFRYRGYNANGSSFPATCSFAADQWVSFARIPVTGLTECTTFEIVTSDAYTSQLSVNSDWFISIGGTNITANSPVVGPGVQLGDCGAVDCEGVAGGSALPGTPCDDADACTTDDTYTAECACEGTPVAAPVITNTSSNSPICADESLSLSVSATTAAGTLSYSWAGSGTFSPNAESASVTVSGAETGDYMVTVSNGCGSDEATISVVVNDVPAAPSTGSYGPVCGTDADVTLGGTPSGGVWTGTGVSGSGLYTFDPSAGTQTLTYTVTSNGCSNSETTTITVETCDCAGVPGGTAFIDDCDDCVGGTTGATACVVDCEGMAGGSALPGTPCDDLDASTGNDTWTATCECEGEVIDCEGVIGGPALPGTSCDDEDPTTSNDTYNSQCVCEGLIVLEDDCLGEPGGPAQPGTPCDDGLATTGNDRWTNDCECVGLLIDCEDVPGGTALPGTPCDDQDPDTNDDVWNANCVCAGVFEDDCLGEPGGPAQPGTPCDDEDPATTNDTWSATCTCEGDPVPTEDCLGVIGGSALPGTPCDDGNVCTTGDVYSMECECVGTFQDSDGDGTCDANDLCPNGPEPGSTCDDGDPNTTGDMVTENCECSGDTGIEVDCLGVPGGSALPGTDCDDENTNTIDDTWTANCECVGTPTGACTEDVTLELQTDANGNQTSWEILSEGTFAVMCEGESYANTSIITETCCLPEGCFVLRVYDSAGDGMASGTNGGYILRTSPENERIIDNRNNFLSGSTSAIANDAGFCLPIGDDRLIFTHCDKLHWVDNEFLVASLNPAVSAEWIPNAPNYLQDANSGYQFWFFDPNGSYSFIWFRRHSNSHGYGVGPARAAHLRINNWLETYHIPENVLMNVRVRGVVDGVPMEWGPACRFMIDPVAAQCPTTKLMDIPGNQYLSCGETRSFGVYEYASARPVSGATQYQFRFRQPAENFEVIRTTNTWHVNLWWANDPLVAGTQYEVDVRAFKNGQWCPWGEVCTLNIEAPAPGANMNFRNEMDDQQSAELSIWPNPNNGDQLYISLDRIPEDVETISAELFDMFGKRVWAGTITTQNGSVNTVMALDAGPAGGMYMMNITAGDQVYTERLMIQR